MSKSKALHLFTAITAAMTVIDTQEQAELNVAESLASLREVAPLFNVAPLDSMSVGLQTALLAQTDYLAGDLKAIIIRLKNQENNTVGNDVYTYEFEFNSAGNKVTAEIQVEEYRDNNSWFSETSCVSVQGDFGDNAAELAKFTDALCDLASARVDGELSFISTHTDAEVREAQELLEKYQDEIEAITHKDLA